MTQTDTAMPSMQTRTRSAPLGETCHRYRRHACCSRPRHSWIHPAVWPCPVAGGWAPAEPVPRTRPARGAVPKPGPGAGAAPKFVALVVAAEVASPGLPSTEGVAAACSNCFSSSAASWGGAPSLVVAGAVPTMEPLLMNSSVRLNQVANLK